MTEENKKLLFNDLCGRLPYGVMVAEFEYDRRISMPMPLTNLTNDEDHYINLRPYLRSLSSMTAEEREELKTLCDKDLSEFAGHLMKGHGLSRDGLYMFDKLRQLDWLNKHHFDFRGLIPKGLALEAEKDMY